MSGEKKTGVFGELYRLLFAKNWPVWVGAILAGMINVMMFAVATPWSGSAGYGSWGKNFYKVFDAMGFDSAAALTDNKWAMLSIMIVLGSFVAALLSKNFAIRIPPVGELFKGLLGGALMAVGATVGIGCSIGGFFSGVPALSGGAIMLTIGLFLGTIVAVKYLFWEMEHLPGISTGRGRSLLGATEDKGNWQKVLGFIMLVVVAVVAYNYFKAGQPVIGWFVVMGGFLGFISQRSIFCIVRAFREPFMSGDADGAKGIIAGILVVLFGFVVIKTMNIGTGEALMRAREMKMVHNNFWLRGLLGGFVFGIGMTIAGGCAVGTLWRMGEGQVKLWFSALGFMLVSPVSSKFIVPWVEDVLPFQMQFKNYLPDYLGYPGAVGLVLLILAVWYWFAVWNERTGKFSQF
jgi:uncharacterized membrane protein YedE/YeeE